MGNAWDCVVPLQTSLQMETHTLNGIFGFYSYPLFTMIHLSLYLPQLAWCLAQCNLFAE